MLMHTLSFSFRIEDSVKAEALSSTEPALSEKVFKKGKRPIKKEGTTAAALSSPAPPEDTAVSHTLPKDQEPVVLFTSLHLSKPVLHALLADMHYEAATPIQVRTWSSRACFLR